MTSQKTTNQSTRRSTWCGIMLMGTAAALFPVKDGFIKALSGSISAVEAGLIYFAVQAAVAFFWIQIQSRQNYKLSLPLKLPPLLACRSISQILAIILFFYSIQHAPLAESVVLFSSNALFVILFSFMFFREEIKPNIVMTALFGFVGVMIVLGPNFWKFGNFYLLFALLSAISFAVYLILTKKMGEIYPPNQMLLVDGVLGVCLISICMTALNILDSDVINLTSINKVSWLYLVASGAIGTSSALLVIWAMKLAPASLIAPVGYTEIVSAAIIGVLIFDEGISVSLIVGCLIILASSYLCGWIANRSGT